MIANVSSVDDCWQGSHPPKLCATSAGLIEIRQLETKTIEHCVCWCVLLCLGYTLALPECKLRLYVCDIARSVSLMPAACPHIVQCLPNVRETQ